ncbi:DeoR/GlpR family DNA-binding transcription regulator [Aeribacillus composti]|jgi:DeoR family transcriptional regulator, glycerol-3-phosphate regulon repressor|uniref:DeoR/GlpR family DNA-binding transcription regulator n=1 Tax=Aeribacillus composti TaxID=1868734 RepID=A0ABY9WCG8_9BACI|nr:MULTISPECIES: DeoR/GlpR family DNA-binding transcription regulator [Aeribacillus]KZM54308.1 DeoR family transcriptional regulator [Aeribacillus pallidus]MED0649472.1 DeoR/GlpR family DNA-binding transcription regulator [Aeribacillus composti]MED4486825.1 DeoR/GlpR family DNA-binding transcription regulator [Aeribacillus pallidus]WNF33368.1 DeoR/GlpR family DNA-binding transcription regulator [Aeribacillus composti]BBU37928.1 DeoR family transcriptional regulator [Aeribacillus pallidus]
MTKLAYDIENGYRKAGDKLLNAAERKEKIIEILKEKKAVKILSLSKMLKVTRETIRKDLYELEKEGLIKKIHGGAVLDLPNQESDYERRKTKNLEAKRAIAKEAAKHVEDGDIIYLDYGTTTYLLAEELLKLKNITVVTNTIPIVNLLLRSDSVNLVILGGMVRKNEDSLYGPFASNNIKNIYVDIGFFGCGGIDSFSGITNHHIGETEISKEMMSHCQNKIILADHSKFGTTAFNQTATFSDVDIIITDKDIDEEIKSEILKHNVEVVIAKGASGGEENDD